MCREVPRRKTERSSYKLEIVFILTILESWKTNIWSIINSSTAFPVSLKSALTCTSCFHLGSFSSWSTELSSKKRSCDWPVTASGFGSCTTIAASLEIVP